MSAAKETYQEILNAGIAGTLTPDEVMEASLELLLLLIHMETDNE